MVSNGNTAMRVVRLLAVILFCGIVAACGTTGGGRYYQDDGPPRFRKGPDPDSVPDAIVKAEPLSRSGNAPYTALGQSFTPMRDARGFRQVGYASWYGRKYHGNRTSSGETYDMYAMTAAHPVLPLPSYVRVRNLDNGKSIVVKVNDRGPFLRDRVIDLSYMAARKLDVVRTGTARVEVTTLFVDDAPPRPGGDRLAVEEQRVQPPTRASSPASSPVQNRFVLQAGSFASRDNAERLASKLRAVGHANVNITRVQVAGRDYHRVQIGPFVNRESAAELAVSIEKQLGSPVSVLSAG
jgi:rare lipoprotein A